MECISITELYLMALFEFLSWRREDAFPRAGNRFGRYTDAWKSPEQQAHWAQALDAWQQGHTLDCVTALLAYLYDAQQKNVWWTCHDGYIEFGLLQGSKVVHGRADERCIRAECKVAHTTALPLDLLQRLTEMNYSLHFSKYALDDARDIVMVTFSHALDASPYKLYYGLRELATHADKQDDLLLEEFPSLSPVEMTHILPLSEEECSQRYRFFHQQLQQLFHELDSELLLSKPDAAAVSCWLLGLIYKLDYLVKPEGYTMELFERLHRNFFANDGRSVYDKNGELYHQLQRLFERSREDFFRELYLVPATFGITEVAPHDRLCNLIDSELPRLEWYIEHRHMPFALAIADYIVGYSLFNYALPPPDLALLHLYYCVRHYSYFEALGMEHGLVDRDTGRLRESAIRRAILAVAKKYVEIYPRFKPSVQMLDCTNQQTFAQSFLQMIRHLDLTQKDV